ncbi:MAG: hypothetical protein KKA35_10635 [Proteobacteria bacterium]|nr:hypothetical protein [Pseudomonadota bacterium]
MRGMVFGQGNGILALIALALGYIVYSLAKKEKGLLKTTGYAIGIAIIAISSVIVLGKVLWTAKMSINMCTMKQSSMPMMSAPAALPKK